MDLLIAANSVAKSAADTVPSSGTPQYATDGNPVTGVFATTFPAYHYNMLMGELYNLVTAAGLTPLGSDWTQVTQAVKLLAKGKLSVGQSGYQIFPSGLMLQWDTVSVPASSDPANNPITVNLPTSFPSGCFGIVGVDYGGDCNPTGANPVNNGQVQLRSFKRNTTSAANTTIVHYLAWGY